VSFSPFLPLLLSSFFPPPPFSDASSLPAHPYELRSASAAAASLVHSVNGTPCSFLRRGRRSDELVRSPSP